MVLKRVMTDKIVVYNNDLIYESPDGGKTIYARQPGFTERILVHEDPSLLEQRRWIKFKHIIELSKTEPRLQELINKTEMLYELLKDDEGT